MKSLPITSAHKLTTVTNTRLREFLATAVLSLHLSRCIAPSTGLPFGITILAVRSCVPYVLAGENRSVTFSPHVVRFHTQKRLSAPVRLCSDTSSPHSPKFPWSCQWLREQAQLSGRSVLPPRQNFHRKSPEKKKKKTNTTTTSCQWLHEQAQLFGRSVLSP